MVVAVAPEELPVNTNLSITAPKVQPKRDTAAAVFAAAPNGGATASVDATVSLY